MPAVAKVWHLLPHERGAIEQLAQQLRIAPIVAQLLLNRGHRSLESAKRFLEAPLAGLHKPDSLPGSVLAVELLYQAIQAKKKICIYGDYDVDGTTGTAILLGLLQRLNVSVEYYVPHRLEEGYGLNLDALRSLAADGVQVIVTVDCGIASLAEAEEAKTLGIQLIVTDHHEMKAHLPNAAACVHPRLPGTNYPFGGLSGAGVAFKLAWSLAVKHCGSEKVTAALRSYLMDSLCLATLGLVADVVPLQDENRILVKAGLGRLADKPPLGIKVLMETAKLNIKEVRAEDIGFRLAPRINAAGRLGCARLVVELFTTTNEKRAFEIAEMLNDQNGRRQAIERTMVQQARDLYDNHPTRQASAVVLAHTETEWHAGVVGIVAGRMVDYTGKPTVLLSIREGGELATGSGRSIPGFELHTALQACDDLLEGHGGHAMAVGVKIHPRNIDAFRERFQAYAAEHFPKGTAPAPRLQLDAEVPLSALTEKVVEQLDGLEPYGADNPRPKFLAGNLVVSDPRRIGQGERHLSFNIHQGSTKMRAVAFSMGDRLDELLSQGGQCCLAFTPKINEFKGWRKVELEVVDFQAGPVATLDERPSAS